MNNCVERLRSNVFEIQATVGVIINFSNNSSETGNQSGFCDQEILSSFIISFTIASCFLHNRGKHSLHN